MRRVKVRLMGATGHAGGLQRPASSVSEDRTRSSSTQPGAAAIDCTHWSNFRDRKRMDFEIGHPVVPFAVANGGAARGSGKEFSFSATAVSSVMDRQGQSGVETSASVEGRQHVVKQLLLLLHSAVV
ncbi:hypothetical protein PR202_ga11663 [Eleusine coracana subsp. coracana]|uniref:Uncharacterized protein n=1 Tax=Eleusine coracana subsp. coracana TaxID=191504 RepID=A0AAV5CA28_ELECO|nr:hypothetical protein PR202_ga11663 [Eleusine coracana subsp. coracana]